MNNVESLETIAADPTQILQVGFGFWSSKVLLSAVKLGVFTALSDRSLMGEELAAQINIHPRAIYDFFDTLVALGFLHRDGVGASGRYRNTPSTAMYLDKQQPSYIGGILELSNDRLFRFWADLDEALQTGKPQNEIKHSQTSLFDTLYADPAKLELFLDGMTGISRGNFQALADKFDFSPYQTLCDVGGAAGILSTVVSEKHPYLQCLSFDLPPVAPIAQKSIDKAGATDRVKVVSGDFFTDTLPQADVITMGLILHDWNLENKKHLIRSAYAALPPGGAFIAIENLIDDDRKENAFGLMMSLNMLVELGDAFDYTGADFWSWCQEAGFQRYEVLHLAGPCSAAIAYK